MKALPDIPLYDQVTWIFQESNFDYIELDYPMLNIDKFKAEAEFAKDYYVDHRDESTGEGTHQGWQACTLYGIDTDKTNHWWVYDYELPPTHDWTELGDLCQYTKNFWLQFPAEFIYRSRFMKLQAGGVIDTHNDNPGDIDLSAWHTLQIPINTAINHPEGCEMKVDNNVVPFADGKQFLVNIFKDHNVHNPTDTDRIHNITHVIPGSMHSLFANLIIRSYKKQYDKVFG